MNERMEWTPELEGRFDAADRAEAALGARIHSQLLLTVAYRQLKRDFPNARSWQTVRPYGEAKIGGKVLTRGNKYVAFLVPVGSPGAPATPAYIKREFARWARKIVAEHPEVSR